MIKQPDFESRNVSRYFYESEAKWIAEINELVRDIELTKVEEIVLIWLAGWDDSTIRNILSVMKKLKTTENKSVARFCK